jgi:hypothetical protein
MKNIILIAFLLSSTLLVNGNILAKGTPVNVPLQYGIKDGWYKATVKYSNRSTGYNGTYTLDVKVSYNSIVTIDFGNDGYIHSGYNNEGYIWYGGYVTLNKDFQGNITSATATVSTSDNNGLRYYDITIE